MGYRPSEQHDQIVFPSREVTSLGLVDCFGTAGALGWGQDVQFATVQCTLNTGTVMHSQAVITRLEQL